MNFGSSKITVYGQTSIKQLEKAGAFENLSVYPENEAVTRIPLWRNKAALRTMISGLLLVIGWGLHLNIGEDVAIYAYLASIVLGGYVLFIQGLNNLIHFRFDMKTLMTIAIFGAAAIGEWGEGATVVFLFAISEALETYSMDRARQSIRSLMDISPKQALVKRDEKWVTVAVEDVRVGDIMSVKPGEKIAMDGTVIEGHSSVNQSAITGESLPVSKSSGNEVFAGTLNEAGHLTVEVTKKVEDTTIAKIIHLVEEAQAEKAPSQLFVDRFAAYYTPAIIVIAAGITTLPPLLFAAEWHEWIYRGLAVLVVGCPCALVISTPVSIVTAIGNAAKKGVLIKGGIHLEEIGRLKAIAVDKTGTLTTGKPNMTDIIVMNPDRQPQDLLGVATAIETQSQHPLATAFKDHAQQQKVDIEAWSVNDFQSLTGKGVKATVNGETYYVGHLGLAREIMPSEVPASTYEKVEDLQAQGKTVMLFMTNDEVLAIFAVMDQPRAESENVIAQLHALGIEKTVMLTGDNRQTGEAISRKLGVKEVAAELLPQDKLEVIKRLKAKYGKVAMVGDGVNDAPALASANVGVAMGGAGTDTALETADVALMADDLTQLPFTVRLSRKALRVIKQNITIALMIKVVALLLIIPNWLTLWMAIFADMGATLLVTLNGLRLLRTT